MVIEIPFYTEKELGEVFEIATYGNMDFGTFYNEECQIEYDDDVEYRCERIANILFKGGVVDLIDAQAYYDDEFYGGYEHKWYNIGEDNDIDTSYMAYPVSLKDIEERLEKCIKNDDHVRDLFMKSKNDMGYIDMCDAYCLAQAMMFGEVIYG